MSRYAISTRGGEAVPPPKPAKTPPKPKPATAPPPPPTTAHPLPSTAKAIVDNAKKLGLQWTMRPATVSSFAFTTTSNPSHIVYDGDSATVAAVSLIGTVTAGSRVLAIQIPPSGNFIIGNLTGQTPSQLIARDRAEVVGAVTITTVQADIADTAVQFPNITGGFYWEAYGTFDCRASVAGTASVFGLLSGPNGLETRVASVGFTGAAGERFTISQSWDGFTGSGTNAAFVLRIVKSAASGTLLAESFNTNLFVKIFQ